MTESQDECPKFMWVLTRGESSQSCPYMVGAFPTMDDVEEYMRNLGDEWERVTPSRWEGPSKAFFNVQHLEILTKEKPPLPDGWRWVGDAAVSVDGEQTSKVFVERGDLRITIDHLHRHVVDDIVETSGLCVDFSLDVARALLTQYEKRRKAKEETENDRS